MFLAGNLFAISCRVNMNATAPCLLLPIAQLLVELLRWNMLEQKPCHCKEPLYLCRLTSADFTWSDYS